MANKSLLALSAALSLYAGSASAEECASAEKETEVEAMAAYVRLQSAYSDADGVQYWLGGSTNTNVYENLDLLLESSFAANYFGYDNIGIQKDSLTDISALLLYNGFPDYSLGSGINILFYEGSGAYAPNQSMELTDYAIGPMLRAFVYSEPVSLSFGYSLGFGEYGNNLAGESFALKNRLSVSIDFTFGDFSAEAEAKADYTYVPSSSDEVFGLSFGAAAEYRFLHFMAVRAFYGHALFRGQMERHSMDSAGAGLMLLF